MRFNTNTHAHEDVWHSLFISFISAFTILMILTKVSVIPPYCALYFSSALFLPFVFVCPEFLFSWWSNYCVWITNYLLDLLPTMVEIIFCAQISNNIASNNVYKRECVRVYAFSAPF